MDITIVICTRNRAEDLQATLRSLQTVYVPPASMVELLIVDNGSTDHTAEVIRQCEFNNLAKRIVTVPQKGKSRALNVALPQAEGKIILFTDDDVRVPENWITGMSAPIRSGQTDAVAGGVQMAEQLRRPWMDDLGTGLFAETRDISPENPNRMVGANMAVGAYVFERVPKFDPRLGAGALGMGEETLFSHQLLAAGYRIASAFDVVVEHHFDPSRLTRAALRKINSNLGRSKGYVAYHWHHAEPTSSRPAEKVKAAKLFLQLQRERLKTAILRVTGISQSTAPISPHEKYLLRNWSYQVQVLEEMSRPRRYEKHGLRLK